MSKKRKKKRERLRKQEIERNRGRVYCTIHGYCEGICRDDHFKRYGRVCSEAFYLTGEGEIPVKLAAPGGAVVPPPLPMATTP